MRSDQTANEATIFGSAIPLGALSLNWRLPLAGLCFLLSGIAYSAGYNYMEYRFAEEHKSWKFHLIWVTADLCYFLATDLLNIVAFEQDIFLLVSVIISLSILEYISRLWYIWKYMRRHLNNWQFEEDGSVIVVPENVYINVAFPLFRAVVRFIGQCALFGTLMTDLHDLHLSSTFRTRSHGPLFLLSLPVQFLSYTQMGRSHINNIFDWWKLFHCTHWSKKTPYFYKERRSPPLLIVRLLMGYIVNSLIFDGIIFLMPILLLKHQHGLEFVKDSFALAFITTLDTSADETLYLDVKSGQPQELEACLEVGANGSRDVEMRSRRTGAASLSDSRRPQTTSQPTRLLACCA